MTFSLDAIGESRPLPRRRGLPALILLNGPKAVGKDLVADALQNLDSGCAIVRLSGIIREVHTTLFFSPGDVLAGKVGDYSDQNFKLSINPDTGLSVRDEMIEIGKWLHSKFPGQTATIAARECVDMLDAGAETCIIPDLRVPFEIAPFRKYFAIEDIALIRLHRPGHTWDKDLGEYLSPEDLSSFDIHNDSTPQALVGKVLLALGVPLE